MLANKYRPSSLEEVVGQQHIVNSIINIVKIPMTEIPRCFLFYGKHGTGKTTLARLFATHLNCDTATSCGQCSPCINIKQICNEVDAAKNNSVDDMKKILNSLRFVIPFGKNRIVIIDEAHNLSKAAFDSMLKTLEDSSHIKVVFIMCTTDINKIPDTIQSRSISYSFHDVQPDICVSRLREICDNEGIAIHNTSLMEIAKAGKGSVRDAINVLSALNKSRNKSISYEEVRDYLGLLSNDTLFDLTDSLVDLNYNSTIAIIADILSKTSTVNMALSQIQKHVRNIIIVNDSLDERYKTKQYDPLFITGLLNNLIKCDERMTHSYNKRLTLELYILKTITSYDIQCDSPAN